MNVMMCDLGLDSRKSLHQGDVAKRIGGAFGEIGVVAFDRLLHALGLADHKAGEDPEQAADHDQQESELPVQQQRKRQQHKNQRQCRKIVAEEVNPDHPERVRAGDHDFH
jgi:hypothetical protein